VSGYDDNLWFESLPVYATHCNTLQHTATHCHTQQHAMDHVAVITYFFATCPDLVITRDTAHPDVTWRTVYVTQFYVTRMRRYACAMSHVNESCHICLSHVTYEYTHMWHDSFTWVTSRTWVTHVTYVSHVTTWVSSRLNESRHIWMRWRLHVTYEWVTMWYTEWVIHMWHDSLTWLIHMWRDSPKSDMTHLVIWCGLEGIQIWVRHDPTHLCISDSWLTCFQGTHPLDCISSRAYVTWLTHEWHDSVTWHGLERIHIWVRHDLIHRVSHVTYEWVTSRMNESCNICMSHVTWK